MRASDVIQALRENGALHTPDNTNIADVRDELAARTAEWSHPPEMPVLGTDGLQQELTRVVENLAGGVRGTSLHDVLVDAGRFGFAIEDLGSQYNARAFSIGDSWLVLVDETLITGFYLAVRALARRLAIPGASAPLCESCGRSACEEYSSATSARRWLEVGLGAHNAETIQVDWTPGEARIYAAHEISNSALSFVVAHEVGHHVRGHTDEANLARLHAVASGEAISEFHTSVQMEIEADVLGCELVLLAAAEAGGNLNQFVNAAIGIEHLWCTLELLERASPRPVNDETHPPIMLRRHCVDRVYAAKEGFEPVRHAVAGYRRLHHDLWRTLAKPSPHDIACWTAEREKVRSRVRDAATAMARFAQQKRHAEFDAASSELLRACSESSKLFFESAVADLTILEGPSSGLGRTTSMAWETLCELPHLMLLMLDHQAPFLGQRVDGPDIPFAEIFVPD